MTFRRVLETLLALALSACGANTSSQDSSAVAQNACGAEPTLQVDPADVERAIGYPDPCGASQFNPVLLIHGTGSTSQESWHGTYIPALTAAGFDVFTLDLPGKAYVDIQYSTEYLVHALRVISSI